MQSSNRPRATRDGSAERCHGSDDVVGQAHPTSLRPAHQRRKRRRYALEEESDYGSSMESCRSHEDDGGTSYPSDDGESDGKGRPSAALTATLTTHIRARTACPSIATGDAKRRKVSHDGGPAPSRKIDAPYDDAQPLSRVARAKFKPLPATDVAEMISSGVLRPTRAAHERDGRIKLDADTHQYAFFMKNAWMVRAPATKATHRAECTQHLHPLPDRSCRSLRPSCSRPLALDTGCSM